MRRGLIVVVVIAALLGAWFVLRPDDGGDSQPAWIVTAKVDNPQAAITVCFDLEGITTDEASFSATADGPVIPGEPTSGVAWPVDTRPHADRVAECLTNLEAVDVDVQPYDGELQDFDRTGP